MSRVVEIGLANPFTAEVTAGLEVGERVVLQPSDRVMAGTRLEPRSVTASVN